MLETFDVRPARTLFLHSREAICEAVAIGLGISLMFSSERPRDSRLVSLRPDLQHNANLTSYIVCRAKHRRSATMRWVNEAAAILQGGSAQMRPGAGRGELTESIPVTS